MKWGTEFVAARATETAGASRTSRAARASVLRLLCGLEAGDDLCSEGVAGEVFDLADEATVFRRGEGDGNAVSAGTAGTADPVDVVFSRARQVEVDHVGDRLDIDPSGRDVGGDEDADFPFAQAGDGFRPLPLVHVAVESRCVVPFFAQHFHQCIGLVFGGCEDDGLFDRFVTEQMVEQTFFVLQVVDVKQTLFDVFVFLVLRGDDNFGRVLQLSLR